ncbi:MAG TPA: deoxyribonuclease IV [Acidobacteriota bacterium]|nr:deoxyribonuclease IV [Acidobacteriota bacterium]
MQPRKSVPTKERTLLGAHVSVAGGVQNAFERGLKIGATAIQIFLKNANQWKARPYDEETIRAFKRKWRQSGIAFVAAHDSYLINIAASDPVILGKSMEALRDELDRAEQLAVRYLVMHPGSHLGEGEGDGIHRVVTSLNQLHSETRGYKTRICLEGTAGQGTNLGYRLEHLWRMIDEVKEPERLGVCLDTCHLLAAGYDFRQPDTYAETFGRIKDLFGKKIKLFHVNDSRKALGSRVDRHAHIGEGEIGLEGFRLLLQDPDFSLVPKIIETPKDDLGTEDIRNLKTLRSLV